MNTTERKDTKKFIEEVQRWQSGISHFLL